MAAEMLLLAAALAVQEPAPVTTLGYCRFDIEQLSFAGSPDEQARCLLSHVGKAGRLSWPLKKLPRHLRGAMAGQPLPTPMAVRAMLAEEQLDLGDMDAPVSRARDNDPTAPLARYFVIHDTSTPNYGDGPFPRDINRDARVNDFAPYFPVGADPEKFPVAHLFLNRLGEVRVGQPLSKPWRATKLETRVIGLPAKGLFLHVETVQPRRRDPKLGPTNDSIAPSPGFTSTQYNRLAQLYVAASVRRGAWLIPAFHGTLDYGLPSAHDDPQNFRLGQFDRSLGRALRRLQAR